MERKGGYVGTALRPRGKTAARRNWRGNLKASPTECEQVFAPPKPRARIKPVRRNACLQVGADLSAMDRKPRRRGRTYRGANEFAPTGSGERQRTDGGARCPQRAGSKSRADRQTLSLKPRTVNFKLGREVGRCSRDPQTPVPWSRPRSPIPGLCGGRLHQPPYTLFLTPYPAGPLHFRSGERQRADGGARCPERAGSMSQADRQTFTSNLKP